MEQHLQFVLDRQYSKVKTLPLSVVMLMLRLRLSLTLTTKLTRKFLYHARSSSRLERESLLCELRSSDLDVAQHLAELIEKDVKGDSALIPPPPPRVSGKNISLVCDTNDFKPFSLSRKWAAQQQFYKSSELSAWTGASPPVPSHVSSNPCVVELYLSRIVNAVQRWSLTSQSPIVHVVVVELGAGHGLLSLLLTQSLRRQSLAARSGVASIERVTVIATDFHDSVFRGLAVSYTHLTLPTKRIV